jgi:hypothetical protein
MKSLVSGLVWAGMFIGLAWSWGYFSAVGRAKATRHKKVCDLCFRDIERVNKRLRQARPGLEDDDA